MDPSMGPSKGYDQDDGDSQADPSITSQPSWALPSQTFFPAQPPTFSQPVQHAQLGYQLYSPDPSYDGNYQGLRFAHSPGSYSNLYQAPQTHTPVSQQPYDGSRPYYAPHATDQTIAPQALQRSNHSVPQAQNLPGYQSQYGSPGGFGPGYGQQYNVTENTGQQTSPIGATGFWQRPSNVLPGGPSGNPAAQASNARPSTLRITHPELLAETANSPSRRIASAPYVVLDAHTEELELPGKVRVVVKKMPKNVEEKLTTPSVGNPNAAPYSPATSTKNFPIKPPKSITSTAKLSNINPTRAQNKDTSPQLPAGSKSTALSPSSDASSSSKDESSSFEGSDDEIEQTSMEPERLSNVRSDMRPSDPVAAAAWDATGIVFVSRHRHATRSEVSKAQQEYLKFLVDLRDDWKKASTDLATAESEKRSEGIRVLKAAQTLKRDVMCSAIRATIDNGHHEIKAYFGKNEKLVATVFSVLRECAKLRDFDSNLPSTIFELMSQFEPLTDDLLQRLKYESVEKRFLNSENTRPDVKAFINAIRSRIPMNAGRVKQEEQNAAQAEKKKVLGVTQNSFKARKVEEPSKSNPNNPSLKRPLEAEASSGKPNKKIASEAKAVGLNQKVVAPKPRSTQMFASMRVAPKSPAPAKAANVSTLAPTKKPDTKPEAESTPRASLVASILAGIENTGEPKASGPPPGPPETPDEKAKREREESRRRRRVHWKDGNNLVEIKWYVPEAPEVEGREDSELKDAHDSRSEGLTLKQGVLDNMDEEEDVGPGEVEFHPYPELKLIDFGEINGQAAEKNYVTKGGTKPVSSTQQMVQNRREAVEVMLVFTDPADIPPSAKEPPLENRETGHAERNFGQPSAPWLHQRIRDIHRHGEGEANAGKNGMQRLEDNRNDCSLNTQSIFSNPAIDIASIMTAIKSVPGQPGTSVANLFGHQPPPPQKFTLPNQQPTQQPQAQQDYSSVKKMDPDALANLEAVFSRYRGLPVPAIEPPAWMNAAQRAEWWEGYNRDKAAVGRKVAEERAANMQSPQAQTMQVQPQIQVPRTTYSQVRAPQPQYSPFQNLQAQYPAVATHPAASAPNQTAPMAATLDPAHVQYARYLLDRVAQAQSNAAPSAPLPTTATAPIFAAGQMQTTQAQYPTMATYPVPSVPNPKAATNDASELQNVLAALRTVQSSTATSQLPSAYAGLNYAQSNSSQPQPQQSWPGAWSVANAGSNSGQAYSAQSQHPHWDAASENSNTMEPAWTKLAENPRATYETAASDNKSRGRDGGRGTEERSRSSNPSDYKRNTKPCKFWKEGKCAKGASCTYQHY